MIFINCCTKSKSSEFVNLKTNMNERRTLPQMKHGLNSNRASHFSFNFDYFNLLQSTKRRSAHLECLCLCTCSLVKLWIQQGIPFLLSSSRHSQTQTFQNSDGNDSASSCTGSTGFLKATRTDKKVSQELTFAATQVPDLRAQLCMLWNHRLLT